MTPSQQNCAPGGATVASFVQMYESLGGAWQSCDATSSRVVGRPKTAFRCPFGVPHLNKQTRRGMRTHTCRFVFVGHVSVFQRVWFQTERQHAHQLPINPKGLDEGLMSLFSHKSSQHVRDSAPVMGSSRTRPLPTSRLMKFARWSTLSERHLSVIKQTCHMRTGPKSRAWRSPPN